MGSEQSKGQAKSTSNQPCKAYGLNCAICEGIFYDPVFLPCGHTFCRICFDVHWELERTRKKCPCPQWTCNLRWEWKPKLRTDEELRAQAERARENLVSSKLCGDGSAWRANERSQACRKLVETFPEWRTRRIEVLKMLFKMIVQLRKRKRDGKISKATGASAGIVGGAMVIAGLALAPLTFGASLGLTIAGTATGVAGSITAAGSSIAVLVMNKASTKEARANVENDKIAGERFAEVVRWVYSVATERDVVTMDTLVSESVSVKGGNRSALGHRGNSQSHHGRNDDGRRHDERDDGHRQKLKCVGEDGCGGLQQHGQLLLVGSGERQQSDNWIRSGRQVPRLSTS
ncbi:uncharacterized protein LOC133359673 [Lethenteron reissneri]|uniref:uncharacterized protein LOC133359673 n=1 Tax=Lethenteron reissneri TaxID=7753 RepID=UPI002AB7E439|nr:uncharacterized protein LOC133359673 [Lethenteron reissneri]